MIIAAGRIAVMRWRALRHATLVIVSLALAHEAIYWSEGQTTLVPQDDAHGYWPAMLALAAIGVIAMSVWSMWRIGVAARAASWPPLTHATTFGSESVQIFKRLLPAVTLAYLVLENVEHLFAHGHVEGIDVFLTPGQLASFPILVGVVALISAIGALVRWREAVVARQALSRRSNPRPARPRQARLVWLHRAELARNARLLFHEDLGRAPPITSY